jgi:hypothetical protein
VLSPANGAQRSFVDTSASRHAAQLASPRTTRGRCCSPSSPLQALSSASQARGAHRARRGSIVPRPLQRCLCSRARARAAAVSARRRHRPAARRAPPWASRTSPGRRPSQTPAASRSGSIVARLACCDATRCRWPRCRSSLTRLLASCEPLGCASTRRTASLPRGSRADPHPCAEEPSSP